MQILTRVSLFVKLHWPGDNEVILRSFSQAVNIPPVYHTRCRFRIVRHNAERQVE